MLQKINEATFPQVFENPLYVQILAMFGEGWEQGIHVRDICKLTGLTDRDARRAVEAIRRAGVVVCTDCLHGYYFPETLEELALYVRQEERRGRSTFYTLKAARQLYKQHGRGRAGE